MRAKAFDSSTRARYLAAKNRGLAYKEAYYWHNRIGGIVPFDDLLSESTFALLRAARRFDPTRGFRFSTMATISCRRQIWNYLNLAINKNSHVKTVSLDSFDNGQYSRAFVPGVLAAKPEIDQMEVREELDLLLRQLPRRDRKIIELYYLRGLRLEDVGREVRISKERVRQILMRSMERLQVIAKERA